MNLTFSLIDINFVWNSIKYCYTIKKIVKMFHNFYLTKCALKIPQIMFKIFDALEYFIVLYKDILIFFQYLEALKA